MRSLEELTPELLRRFMDLHAPRGKTHLRLVVWALRTFGAYLAVKQYLPDSLRKDLWHPVLRATRGVAGDAQTKGLGGDT